MNSLMTPRYCLHRHVGLEISQLICSKLNRLSKKNYNEVNIAAAQFRHTSSSKPQAEMFVLP